MVAIHILSDLHLDFSMIKNYSAPQGTDLVVLAGDVHPGVLGVIWASETFKDLPVLIVPGNHEYYGKRVLPEHLQRMKDKAAQTANVKVLDRETFVFRNTRFICATLWTDYCLFGDQALAMKQAFGMNDYSRICIGRGRLLKPINLLREHELSRNFIEQELKQPFDGETVVVTHHAPSPNSCADVDDAHQELSPCYASNLESLILKYQPDLWIHGHIHLSREYMIGSTKIFANPRGYVESRKTGVPQNKEWNSNCLLNVSALYDKSLTNFTF